MMSWIRSLLSKRIENREPRASDTAPQKSEHAFAVGQVWRYRTRPHEPDSRAIIGKIEAGPRGGVIVHVKIIGVRIRNPHRPGTPIRVISHSPVAEETVRQSVTSLEAQIGDLTDFQDGYETWSRAGEDGGPAGIFDIPLSQIVTYMEEALTQGSPVP